MYNLYDFKHELYSFLTCITLRKCISFWRCLHKPYYPIQFFQVPATDSTARESESTWVQQREFVRDMTSSGSVLCKRRTTDLLCALTTPPGPADVVSTLPFTIFYSWRLKEGWVVGAGGPYMAEGAWWSGGWDLVAGMEGSNFWVTFWHFIIW